MPSSIGTFSNLKQLHFSANELTFVPDDIGLLKRLEVLSLDNNQLFSLPDGFVGLSNLTSLKLSRNKFEEFPKVLCHLASLDNLDMSSNLIEQLPDEVMIRLLCGIYFEYKIGFFNLPNKSALRCLVHYVLLAFGYPNRSTYLTVTVVL